MRKIITGIAIMAMVGVGNIASADYKDEAKADIEKVMNQFFQVEQNNRLTPNNMRALMQDIGAVLEKNFIIPKAPPAEEKGKGKE